MHSERYFLQFSYLLYKQETLLLGWQNLLLQPACNAQHRQQKATNTSLLESRSLLQTATLVFPRPSYAVGLVIILICWRKKIARPPTGGMAPPGPRLDPPLSKTAKVKTLRSNTISPIFSYFFEPSGAINFCSAVFHWSRGYTHVHTFADGQDRKQYPPSPLHWREA